MKTHLLRPPSMRRSATNVARLPDPTNVIDAHMLVDGNVQIVRRKLGVVGGAAAGVTPMAPWLSM